MAGSHSPSFLTLSTELRLEVYQHLIIDCLAAGALKGLSGLYLSCREVHQELESEYIQKIRPLLHAQRQWTRYHRQYRNLVHESLPLRLSHHDLFSLRTGALSTLTIDLPPLPPHESYSFDTALARIRPLLRLPWSVLTLTLCDHGTNPDQNFACAIKRSEAFFKSLAHIQDDDACNLARIDRLVLNYGNADDILDETHFRELFQVWQFNWFHSGSLNLMPLPKRGWISRKQGGDNDDGWKLTYDYVDGLAEVEGALWAIVKEHGWWGGRRWFKGMENVGEGKWEHEFDWEHEEDDDEDEDDDDEDDEDELQSDEDGEESIDENDECTDEEIGT
ncbi:Nn.00g082180.m01.CDS01 [Neocucurbitaria sp. VM-36]